MSKSEQAALVAFINSFDLARRVTAFNQLYDGKALTEVNMFTPLRASLTRRS